MSILKKGERTITAGVPTSISIRFGDIVRMGWEKDPEGVDSIVDGHDVRIRGAFPPGDWVLVILADGCLYRLAIHAVK